MAWTYLLIAGLLEIGWAIGLKYSDGWTRQWPSVLTVATMAASPVGTAYAIWTGIGAAGTAIVGMVLFAESAAPSRRASG